MGYPMCFRVIILLTYCLFLSTEGNSQNRVTANITNFKNNKGVCQVCLFDNPAAFKGTTGKPVACKRIKVENKTVIAMPNLIRISWAFQVKATELPGTTFLLQQLPPIMAISFL
jgi:hypothetical protein